MASFQYIARDETGQRVQGVIDADSQAAALNLLSDQHLFPVEVNPHQQQRTMPTFNRVRMRDVGIFYGQLADLLNSGVPLLRAIDTLTRSTTNKRLVEVLKQIRADVADGSSLTDAMRQCPEIFPTLHTAMVQAGERAGFLEDVLVNMSQFLERLDDLRSKVIGALIYPALLILIGMVVAGALLFFVPRFEPLLRNVEVPTPTVIVFGLSTFVREYWLLTLVMAALVIGGLAALWNNPRGRELFERCQIRLPVIGTALRMVAITRFCRILGTMMVNGVPLLQALAISRDASGSKILADRIDDAIESVRAGESLTKPLAASQFFPAQVLAMIDVAEQSNKLEKVLIQIADTVERRTNRQVDQAVRLVEPLILCLIAAGIGFLALGLLLPIFTMASTLGG